MCRKKHNIAVLNFWNHTIEIFEPPFQEFDLEWTDTRFTYTVKISKKKKKERKEFKKKKKDNLFLYVWSNIGVSGLKHPCISA